MDKIRLFDYIEDHVAIPFDSRGLLFDKIRGDNLGLLLNKLAFFGIKDKLHEDPTEPYSTQIEEALDSNDKELKAYFYYQRKDNVDSYVLNLISHWKTNVRTHLKEYYGICEALYTDIGYHKFDLKSNWRTIIGMGNESVYENGFTFHPTYGIPYLPGSSIKGMIRHWAIDEGLDKTAEIEYLTIFGNENGNEGYLHQGEIVFLDAFPIKKKIQKDKVKELYEITKDELHPDIMNNHYPDYYGDGECPRFNH